MRDSDWEDLMRGKAILSVETGSSARLQGKVLSSYSPSSYDGIQIQDITRINIAASQFAHSCEHFLKATTMYYYLKDSAKLRSSSNQLDVVNKKIENFLKNPANMKDEFPEINAAIGAMSSSDMAGGGHSLFTYYQIQTPVIKTLINHEFLSADPYNPGQPFTYIDLGILTRDFIKEGPNGQLYLPQDLLDHYRKYRAAYIDYRFVATNNEPANRQDLENLNVLSAGLEKIMCHCFPEVKPGEIDFSQSKLESELGDTIEARYKLSSRPNVNTTIQSLDKANSFYMKNDFSRNEFVILLRSLDSIDRNRAINNIDKDLLKKLYLNLCIYMKHAAVMQQANINFDERVFKRIEYYTRLVMNPNLFNADALQLQNTEFFQIHKSELEEELKAIKEGNKSKTKVPSMEEYVDEIINNWEEYENDNNWQIYIRNHTGNFHTRPWHKHSRSNWIEFRDAMFKKLFNELKNDSKYDSARDVFLDYYFSESNIFFMHAVQNETEVKQIIEDLIEYINNADINKIKNEFSNTYFNSSLNTKKNYISYIFFVKEKENPKYENGRNNINNLYPGLSMSILSASKNWMALGFDKEELADIVYHCGWYFEKIFFQSTEALNEKINNIVNVGFSREDVKKMIHKYPFLLDGDAEKMASVKDFFDELGLTKLIIEQPIYLRNDLEKLQKRYDYLKKVGVTIDGSDSDILLYLTPEELDGLLPHYLPKSSENIKKMYPDLEKKSNKR